MYEEADDRSWLTTALELLSDTPELTTYEEDASLPFIGEAELADFEGSPETWNNGPSVTGPSESEYIDQELLASIESGVGVPPQVVPGQIVAGSGSVDGLQVAAL